MSSHSTIVPSAILLCPIGNFALLYYNTLCGTAYLKIVVMAIHLPKTAQILLDERDIGDPVLASAYVKFSPVPEEWKYLLESDIKEDNIELDPKLNKVADIASAFASLLSTQEGTDARAAIIPRKGSLEIYVPIVCSLITIFSPDIRNGMKSLYNKSNISAHDVRELVSKMMKQIHSKTRNLKRITASLHAALVEVMGMDNLQNPPQARGGVLQSLEKFNDSFNVAKSKTIALKERVKAMKKSVRQARQLQSALINQEDRTFIHIYMSLRTRDRKLYLEIKTGEGSRKQIDEYNEIMREIEEIRDDLKSKDSIDDDF